MGCSSQIKLLTIAIIELAAQQRKAKCVHTLSNENVFAGSRRPGKKENMNSGGSSQKGFMARCARVSLRNLLTAGLGAIFSVWCL
jgi:hypothetical protein